MNTNKLNMIGIVAIAKNHVIGHNNRLPWNIPEDLKFFKKQTMGHVLIMGRNTFESLPTFGLKGRICIVVTSKNILDVEYEKDSPVYFRSLNKVDELLDKILKIYPEKKLFVIGGHCLFDHFTEKIQKFIVTHIEKDYIGDVFYDIDHYRYSNTEIIDEFYCDTEDCQIKHVVYSTT